MKFRPGYLALAPLTPLGAAVAHAALTPRKTSAYQPQPDPDRAMAYAEKLSAMIRCDTTSHANVCEPEKFERFHALLAELFPLVHEKLARTDIDGNLLYYWPGRAHDRPIVLMSHQDVVPAEGTWTHAPFSGDIAGGKVWGRGASDTKCSVMAFFQAVEELLAAGYEPANDVYIASSCTEEWAGDGAPKLVAELKRRGVRPFLVCDEGGGIITEPIGGIPGNFAMVGVFEKGKADVKFTARSTGGHASAPTANTPIARLSAFVTDVEKHAPFRKKFLPEVTAMFTRLAPYAPFGLRLVMGNLWLFAPLMKVVLPRVSAQAGAMAAHDDRVHDAVRLGRVQRPAAGGDAGCEHAFHPASGRAGESGHHPPARRKARSGDGGRAYERLLRARGHPRRGVPPGGAGHRRDVPRPARQPLCHDRRDGCTLLSGDLRQLRALCACDLRPGADEGHAWHQ